MSVVKTLVGGILPGMASSSKTNVAAEQAKLKAAQDKAMQEELTKAAQSQANKENQYAATRAVSEASASTAINAVDDTEQSRRKFLKKV